MADSAPSRDSGTSVGPRPPPDGVARHGHKSPWRTAVTLLALLPLAAAVVVVTLRESRPSPHLAPEATPPRPSGETDAPFPSETAADVVSYSDHVAVVTAVAEADASPTALAPGIDGSRIVMRVITFQVDEVLWSRPTAPPSPVRFRAEWWGWIVRDGTRTPFIVSGAPAVFLGAQYLVPIAYDGRQFSLLQPYAVFRLRAGAVVLEEQRTALAHELSHSDRAQIAQLFKEAVPDPVAVQYRHLLPRARLAAVLDALRSPPG